MLLIPLVQRDFESLKLKVYIYCALHASRIASKVSVEEKYIKNFIFFPHWQQILLLTHESMQSF